MKKKFVSVLLAAAIAAPMIVSCAASAADAPEVRCIYCKSTSYGAKCPSRTDGGPHKHGQSSQKNKCVYCGIGKMQGDGKPCSFGPGKKHEF